MKLNCRRSRLPFKSLLHFEGSVSNLERYISALLETLLLAHYQHPSSGDMLWKLALCTAAPTGATCISPSLSQGQMSTEAVCTSTTCAKA